MKEQASALKDERIEWRFRKERSGLTLVALLPAQARMEMAEFMKALDDTAPIAHRDHPLHGIGYHYRTLEDRQMEFIITSAEKITAICERLEMIPDFAQRMDRKSETMLKNTKPGKSR